ncbi:PP2C family serine/threonine-protein phosphatase [Criblamydia sequanensis]|uniref:PPM-type phosphatase domain-containing protein n=1 Tax=Candidatus Criblamydia sequanensis CRIB-18 TaxID=1437425 RepID=A0A090CZ06_9BACT|nr:PP2C family serine/threonine-protein phosphatase [Criblamydia sequanensis]CDR34067.1 hypothetical protein CSEC_1247 [Criblamydia sequanensis CRIB-18]
MLALDTGSCGSRIGTFPEEMNEKEQGKLSPLEVRSPLSLRRLDPFPSPRSKRSGSLRNLFSPREKQEGYSAKVVLELRQTIDQKCDKLLRGKFKKLNDHIISLKRNILTLLKLLNLEDCDLSEKTNKLDQFLNSLYVFLEGFLKNKAEKIKLSNKLFFVRELLLPLNNSDLFPKDQKSSIYSFYFGKFIPLVSSISWEHIDEVGDFAISSIKDEPLSKKPTSFRNFKSVLFNNYGLLPQDFSYSIETDDEEYVARFQFGGKWYEIPKNLHIICDPEQRKMLFLEATTGALENHDQCKIDVIENFLFLGLTDGCGQNRGATVSATRVLDEITSYLIVSDLNKTKTVKEALKIEFEALKHTQEILIKEADEIRGDTTLTFCLVKGNSLTGLSVGDSKIFILRRSEGDWKIFDLASTTRTSPEDCGGRLVGTGSTPELAALAFFSFKLMEGDIVFLCSDGVSDCFDPAILKNGSPSLIKNLEDLLKENSCRNAEEMEDLLVRELQLRTFEEKRQLFAGANKVEPTQGSGKLDNANMCFYTYKKMEN